MLFFKQKTVYEMRMSDWSADVCSSDLAVESDLQQFFYQPGMRWDTTALLNAMRHPHFVMTFSDAGAHVTQQECSLQTYLLAHWVRKKQEFTLEEAVRMVTLAPAEAWGCIEDRKSTRLNSCH